MGNGGIGGAVRGQDSIKAAGNDDGYLRAHEFRAPIVQPHIVAVAAQSALRACGELSMLLQWTASDGLDTTKVSPNPSLVLVPQRNARDHVREKTYSDIWSRIWTFGDVKIEYIYRS